MKLKVYYGVDNDPAGGGFFWPDSQAKRKELLSVKRNHPAIYESVYQCRPGRREGAIFLEGDFVSYKPPKNLHLGMADSEVIKFCSNFHSIIAAWDTAFESSHDSDNSVGLAAGLLPCDKYHRGEDPMIFGPCEPHLDVYLLDLWFDKLQWGDLAKAFREFHQKWRPLVHVVEKRSSGIPLAQSMPTIGITVVGVVSNESKRARAVSGVEAGSTQGWFRQWRVRVPEGALWVPDYKTELKDFTGEDDATDDKTDATINLVNYAIEASTSMPIISSEWTPEMVDRIILEQERYPEPIYSAIPARAEFLSWLQMLPEASGDPMEGFCQSCDNFISGFCKSHKRQVTPFDTCEFYTSPLMIVS